MLFTCSAVYLDIAEDYSTQAILHFARRLTAERGEVLQLISDPGTYMCAAKELKEVREGWDKAELVRFGANHGIEWKFVISNSQHRNGVTEANECAIGIKPNIQTDPQFLSPNSNSSTRTGSCLTTRPG